jgi:hypothetical protein
MSTPVLHRESAPARETGGGENQRLQPGRAKRHALQNMGISPYPARFERSAALADALFTSDLSARCEHTPIEVATAIRHAIGTHAGTGGCAAEVAAEYGEHPETAARRMRWARAVVDGIDADWGAFLGRRTRESL